MNCLILMRLWKIDPRIQSGFSVTAALFIVGPYFIDTLALQWVVLSNAAGVIIGLSGLIIRFSIRCPVCGSYWYFRAARTLPVKSISNWLNKQEKCPVCGVSGKVSAQ